MRLYKYLTRQHAKNMLAKGEVKIGTLSHYRTIEDATRADVNEGRRDSITDFPDGARVTNKEEWEHTLGFLKGSNIKYVSGTVQIEPGTRFIGDDDVKDAYVYCTSKVYSRALQRRFQAECCIEIYNPQGFLEAIEEKLSDLGLIYRHLSSGRDIEYTL